MILWLDHKIFGNGHGFGSPYFDNKFYWLSGELYTFMHGFGAQLNSVQWRHPKAGEERTLFGYKFRPFRSERRFWWLWRNSIFAIPLPIGRVMVAWARTDLPAGIDEANAALREMESQIGCYFPRRS